MKHIFLFAVFFYTVGSELSNPQTFHAFILKLRDSGIKLSAEGDSPNGRVELVGNQLTVELYEDTKAPVNGKIVDAGREKIAEVPEDSKPSVDDAVVVAQDSLKN